MDAVIGVLGVFEITWLDGVWAFRSSLSLSFSASILAAIGVPKGNKFKGGSFKGCRPFLPPSTVEFRDRGSGVFVELSVELSGSSTSAVLDAGFASESESREIFNWPISVVILDFLGAGKTGASNSPFGDS